VTVSGLQLLSSLRPGWVRRIAQLIEAVAAGEATVDFLDGVRQETFIVRIA
jgi:hypothetical protein